MYRAGGNTMAALSYPMKPARYETLYFLVLPYRMT